MELLSIGNSFSQDAHKWLHKLAEKSGICLNTVNLYMPGCNLSTHWHNIKENLAEYELELNGESGQEKITISDALSLRKWDIITLQQVSQDSGKYETYEPFLSSLAAFVKKAQPEAKLYLHSTWAYETDSQHPGFVNYHHDQEEMYRRIQEASERAAVSIGAPLSPAGKIIQILRETVPEFQYQNGGMSLCRDGFHLSLHYGRFAAAATWLHTLTGKEITVTEFEDFDSKLLEKILDVVNAQAT